MISCYLKYLFFCFLVIAAIVNAEEPQEIRLNDLIAEAVENNPELKAARYKNKAAETRISQAKAWEAPQIGVELPLTPVSSFPNPFKDSMETDFFIQQKIPFPGKIDIMTRSEKSYSEMSVWNSKSLENIVIRDLKKAYYELYLMHKKIKINAESQDLMRQFTSLARKQYEVGKGSQADILRAQTELSIMINEGESLIQEKRISETMINTILGRPHEQALGAVPDINIDNLPKENADLVDYAIKNRPELKAMDENILMKTAEHDLARREYYPDIMLRLMYKGMDEGPDDYFATMVSMDIPFMFWSGGKIRGRVEESRIDILKAKEDLHSMENMTRYQIREAMLSAETSRKTMQLYKSTVIPQAEQTREAMRAAYSTGSAELFSLIEALRMELQARLDYHTAVSSYMRNLAALDQAAGIGIIERSSDPSPDLSTRRHP